MQIKITLSLLVSKVRRRDRLFLFFLSAFNFGNLTSLFKQTLESTTDVQFNSLSQRFRCLTVWPRDLWRDISCEALMYKPQDKRQPSVSSKLLFFVFFSFPQEAYFLWFWNCTQQYSDGGGHPKKQISERVQLGLVRD